MTEDASLDQFGSSDTGDGEDSRETDADDGDDAAETDPDDAESATADSPADSSTDAGSSDGGRSADSPEADPASAADPAVSTFEWSPAGGECADCGASVERRWRADGEREGGLVCADCKEW